MRAELTRAQSEVERMSAELDAKNAKLLESEQLLSTNNQVITYLNKEVNEAQLGRRQFGGTAAGASSSSTSRHAAASAALGSFQPTSPGAGTSVLASRQMTAAFPSSGSPAPLQTVTYKSRAATTAYSATAATTAPAKESESAPAPASSSTDRLIEGGEGLLLGAGALAALQRSLEDDEYVGGGGSASRPGAPSSLVAGSSVSPHTTLAQN